MHGRVDLRALDLLTIDGEDARDFDDAVYCEPRRGGGWRLLVAIADVSHYVRPGTALDVTALERGNSVYLPSTVVPMLPEQLSNDLCSLRPKVDRLCMVCEMTVSARGRVGSYRFFEGVMNSSARLTYNRVARLIEHGADAVRKDDPENLHDLFGALIEARGRVVDFPGEPDRARRFGSGRGYPARAAQRRSSPDRGMHDRGNAARASSRSTNSPASIGFTITVGATRDDLRAFLAGLGIALPGEETD